MKEHYHPSRVQVTSRRYPELWRRCDVTDPSSLADVLSGCDVVVKLAAEHHDDIRPNERYYDVTNNARSRSLFGSTNDGPR